MPPFPFQYNHNPRPNFGMGKCFFVEALPYFGDFVYERALSQNNMTHVHGEVNWEYTYNEIGLPTMINVIWPGVELLTPTSVGMSPLDDYLQQLSDATGVEVIYEPSITVEELNTLRQQ